MASVTDGERQGASLAIAETNTIFKHEGQLQMTARSFAKWLPKFMTFMKAAGLWWLCKHLAMDEDSMILRRRPKVEDLPEVPSPAARTRHRKQKADQETWERETMQKSAKALSFLWSALSEESRTVIFPNDCYIQQKIGSFKLLKMACKKIAAKLVGSTEGSAQADLVCAAVEGAFHLKDQDGKAISGIKPLMLHLSSVFRQGASSSPADEKLFSEPLKKALLIVAVQKLDVLQQIGKMTSQTANSVRMKSGTYVEACTELHAAATQDEAIMPL